MDNVTTEEKIDFPKLMGEMKNQANEIGRKQLILFDLEKTYEDFRTQYSNSRAFFEALLLYYLENNSEIDVYFTKISTNTTLINEQKLLVERLEFAVDGYEFEKWISSLEKKEISVEGIEVFKEEKKYDDSVWTGPYRGDNTDVTILETTYKACKVADKN